MIDKSAVMTSLRNNLEQGKDELTAIQHTFQQLIDNHPDEWDYESKKLVLNGVLAFAGNFFGQTYGYKEFDLVMGRTYPNAETLRGISEEEGRNLYDDRDRRQPS